jgi:hypothetical protein
MATDDRNWHAGQFHSSNCIILLVHAHNASDNASEVGLGLTIGIAALILFGRSYWRHCKLRLRRLFAFRTQPTPPDISVASASDMSHQLIPLEQIPRDASIATPCNTSARRNLPPLFRNHRDTRARKKAGHCERWGHLALVSANIVAVQFGSSNALWFEIHVHRGRIIAALRSPL